MKNTHTPSIFLLLLFLPISIWAQIGINETEAAPHPSAILDVSSTDKGLLIPRMTDSQRDNIAQPATGLMVFVNNDSSFYFYNGSLWERLNPPQIQLFDSLISLSGGTKTLMLAVDPTDGSLSLLDEAMKIGTDGSLALSGIDIKDAGSGTNRILMQGEPGTDKWIHFQNGGTAPQGRAGIILSDQDLAHYFVYNEGSHMNFAYSTEASDHPDVDQATSLMRLSSDGELEVNGSFQLITGNEGEGKVLTSGPNGEADWADPPNPSDRVAFVEDNNGQNFFGSTFSSWERIIDYSTYLSVNQGDLITVKASFAAELASGSGSDPLRFRIIAEGSSGCSNLIGKETAALDAFQEVRGHRFQTPLQWTFTTNCRGTYRFSVEADFSNTDDRVVIGRASITATKF